MAIVKSIVFKSGKEGGTGFWVCVVGDEEVLAFDPKIKEYEGKECPFPIAGGEGGKKKYIQFPKAGGFQKGGAGGGWKGKSDKELYLQALTMSLSYAKDEVVAKIMGSGCGDCLKETLTLYEGFSTRILADLAKLVPDAPKQTEAPKEAMKAPGKPPQETSPPRTGTDKEAKTVKEKLEKKMWAYLQNQHSDNDQNFKALLIELTSFEGKDGKTVYVDNFENLSDKWAGSCVGKLEILIEQEERKNVANADLGEDVPY